MIDLGVRHSQDRHGRTAGDSQVALVHPGAVVIARAWTVLLVLAVAAGDHGLGGLVTWLEKRAYAAQSPRVGGTPAHGIPPTAGVVDGPSSGSVPPLRPAAGPALPGEGQWRTVVAVHGRPAVQVAPCVRTGRTPRSSSG
jgi:hypothetical protein